jgi:hypothetical protein
MRQLNIKTNELFKTDPEKKEQILKSPFWDLLDLHVSVTSCESDLSKEIRDRYSNNDEDIRKMKSINHLDFLSNEGVMLT